jgi:predicted RNA methylase
MLTRVYKLLKIIKGLDWYAFAYKLKIILNRVDLSIVYPAELGLSPDRVYWSSSSGGAALGYVLRTLRITHNDSIIDVGCGKGGAIITLCAFKFGKVAGVELSDKLVDIALQNLKKLKITGVPIHCCDAVEFSRYDEFNYIYV